MSRYPVPAQRRRGEEVIRRSRFVTTVAPAASVQEAHDFIAEMRAEFSDATHNCYAYVVGPPGTTLQVGMSDDGEPGGTAGRPMLAVLLGSGVGDIAAVVTRYFGGTKLGTGGLVRAYSGGVKQALVDLPTIEKITRVTVLVTGHYRWVTPVERLLPVFEAETVGQEFTDRVAWQLAVPEERAEELGRALTELSHGELEVSIDE